MVRNIYHTVSLPLMCPTSPNHWAALFYVLIYFVAQKCPISFFFFNWSEQQVLFFLSGFFFLQKPQTIHSPNHSLLWQGESMNHASRACGCSWKSPLWWPHTHTVMYTHTLTHTHSHTQTCVHARTHTVTQRRDQWLLIYWSHRMVAASSVSSA